MRVALCFSGQLRNVRQTYEQSYLPQILTPNSHHQIDVFSHSWYDKTTTGTQFITAGGGVGSNVTPANIIEEVYQLYNPIATILQQQIQFDERNYNDNKYPMIKPMFTLSKMFSTWLSIQLKINHEAMYNFTYDVVAIARYDWIFHQPVAFDIVQAPGVYHPGCNPHGINVGYVMGDSSSMNHYASLFHNVSSVYDRGVPFCDEILAQEFLLYTNTPIHNFAIPSTINRG